MGAADKWLLPLVSVSVVSLLLFLSALSGFSASSALFARLPPPSYVRRGAAAPPSFAYLLAGGRGDGRKLLRLLLAVYHPRNRYLLHLSADAPDSERAELAAAAARAAPAARAFGNVDVVGRPTAGTPMGSSGLAATLRAAAAMLRLDAEWDWFITLSAADYPLLTQDDLIHVFSSVPRHLNFIDHTSDIGWKESQRVQPVIVDAGIYLAGRNQFFQATEKRDTPDGFKFFTGICLNLHFVFHPVDEKWFLNTCTPFLLGSPWVILNRHFVEYCVFGWENLPRTLLMYFTNVMLPLEGYFHSVACNSDFHNFTVNNDLRYVVWDDPPQMEPHFLNVTHYDELVGTGVPFARKFKEDEPLLDMIDDKVLRRWRHRPVPGAWCTGKRRWFSDPCSQWSNVNIVRPGPQAEKFRTYINQIMEESKSSNNSCKQ
ncbi:beta-glucuronosyltransferase GlcAT14A isoform X1 [Zea mays]|uniref:BGGP Beta-1-3-galactosyl-O-glycosyl-glycoprotein n=1 Tax=Zea mays TaxID=4577 RepID=A0A804N0N9_MAIZE|nr:beta-glucuronosyltransferase GlcAT14A isoform X1 [Zea mays]|eukprot:XP_020405727.1 beta-glucuronosyltransferase GlcAT14A isoform X1 [Zea mays]